MLTYFQYNDIINYLLARMTVPFAKGLHELLRDPKGPFLSNPTAKQLRDIAASFYLAELAAEYVKKSPAEIVLMADYDSSKILLFLKAMGIHMTQKDLDNRLEYMTPSSG